MYRLTVDPPWDYTAWRAQARRALAADVPPQDVEWAVADGGSLLAPASLPTAPQGSGGWRVPRDFATQVAPLAMHDSAWRHALPYRLLWRLTHGEPELLRRTTDPDMLRVQAMQRELRRDLHKMKAFVRFRAVADQDDTFVAWFEPMHQIVDEVAPFFARRFAGMRWSILTPYRSVHWDGSGLSFGAGASKADAPDDDALEALWRRYYAHIFNPARLNTRMMRKEMPQRYWKNLPEAQLIPALVRDAGARAQAMVDAMPPMPSRRIRAPKVATMPAPTAGSLDALRSAADTCRRCELWEHATQTVFGEGPADARLMVVGEQPGDEEDLRGRPFVGPAGRLFDRALAELGMDRAQFYVTNAVKHFRFEMRGKFRLHRNPTTAQVRACNAWLERELSLLRPQVVLCLGATAARAVFGNDFQLMQQRGRWIELGEGRRGLATVHPSWILRQRAGDAAKVAWQGFLDDLAMLPDAIPPALLDRAGAASADSP